MVTSLIFTFYPPTLTLFPHTIQHTLPHQIYPSQVTINHYLPFCMYRDITPALFTLNLKSKKSTCILLRDSHFTQADKSLYTGNMHYHRCSGQSTYILAVGKNNKNESHVFLKQLIKKLIDNCTNGSVFFPCIYISLTQV